MSELKKNPKISVIIPVYRPGELFYRCIDSVCNQTLRDIEIILVDDCGNDETFDHVRRLESEDPRIHIITNEKNSGPGISRNKAIDCANGEYVAFLDADDYMSDDFLELLYQKAENTKKPHIVCGSYVTVNTDGKVIDSSVSLLNIANVKKWKPDNSNFDVFSSTLWCNIYQLSWVKNEKIYCGTSYYGEDSFFLLQASWKARSLFIEEQAIVFHVDNDRSLMHTFKPERLQYQALAFNEQMSFLKDNVTSSVPSDYIIKRLLWYLENHAVASSFDRYYRETELFLQSLKETVLNLPWADEIKKKSPFAKALLEYNYNLRAPYLNPFMADITDKACIQTFSRCLDFIGKHPDQRSIYICAVNTATEKALRIDTVLKKISRVKRKSFRKSCAEIFKKESKSNISSENLVWFIYLKTGMNLLKRKDMVKRIAHFTGKIYHFGAKKLWKRKSR